MPFKAVIFDFDLTLADSKKGVIACVGYALEELGLPAASDQRICESIGLSMPATLEYVSGHTDPDLADRFNRLFIERADQVMAMNTELYPPAPSVIRALQTGGCALGIVSSKLRYRIEGILARERLSDAFPVIVGGGDAPHHKPHPAGLQLAINRLGYTPEEAVYIGDHPVDGEAARSDGITFIGVLTGLSEPADLLAYAPLDIIEDLSALPSILLESEN